MFFIYFSKILVSRVFFHISLQDFELQWVRKQVSVKTLVTWNNKPIMSPEVEVCLLFNPINASLKDPNLP